MYKTLFNQTAREIMLSLVNNVHEKNITKSQDRRNIESPRAIGNLNSYYNF